jgi:hypothetical protein
MTSKVARDTIYCAVVFAIEENLPRGVSLRKRRGSDKVGIIVGAAFMTTIFTTTTYPVVLQCAVSCTENLLSCECVGSVMYWPAAQMSQHPSGWIG